MNSVPLAYVPPGGAGSGPFPWWPFLASLVLLVALALVGLGLYLCVSLLRVEGRARGVLPGLLFVLLGAGAGAFGLWLW
ncbi:hypothetical protein [Streptacidiphilus monticola]|uniref:Uncharacterized protein n=1 Tax=Streptacidiphilus monticola TaxID=2161674 RepID=A0ABW1G497_9ACTN